jgi:hypothetical protein
MKLYVTNAIKNESCRIENLASQFPKVSWKKGGGTPTTPRSSIYNLQGIPLPLFLYLLLCHCISRSVNNLYILFSSFEWDNFKKFISQNPYFSDKIPSFQQKNLLEMVAILNWLIWIFDLKLKKKKIGESNECSW